MWGDQLPVSLQPAGQRVVVKIRNHGVVLDWFFSMKPLNAFSSYVPVNGFFAVG